MTKWFSNISPRHIGLAAMCALAPIYLLLCRYDNYGIDEGAARGLLVNWSIASHMLSPIAVLGLPDFRALLFMPLNFHWVGDITAAKVLTMFLVLGFALMIYRWAVRTIGEETALIGTGLLLFAPITFAQIDSVGAGIYLLMCAIICAWLDTQMRASKHTMQAWYFLQMLFATIAVSIHPAGLGIVAAILWHWFQDDTGLPRKRTAVFVGLTAMSTFILLAKQGWLDITLFTNPLLPLSTILLGNTVDTPADIYGIVLATLLVLTLIFSFRNMMHHLFSTMLLISTIIGMLAADAAWAYFVTVILLYHGLALLIQINTRLGWRSMAGQRGMVFVMLTLCATLFMQADKQRYSFITSNRMMPVDKIISQLAEIAISRDDQAFLAASQWPARTMLACKRDVLPLPPVRSDSPEQLLHQMKGVTHLIFDPQDPRNKKLALQTASLSQYIKTVRVMPEGIILSVRAPTRINP